MAVKFNKWQQINLLVYIFSSVDGDGGKCTHIEQWNAHAERVVYSYSPFLLLRSQSTDEYIYVETKLPAKPKNHINIAVWVCAIAYICFSAAQKQRPRRWRRADTPHV